MSKAAPTPCERARDPNPMVASGPPDEEETSVAYKGGGGMIGGMITFDPLMSSSVTTGTLPSSQSKNSLNRMSNPTWKPGFNMTLVRNTGH